MAAENKPDLMGARGIIALGAATVGSIVCGFIAVWVKLSHVSRAAPQLGMQAILAGLIAIPVAWVVLFFLVRWVVGLVASRKNDV